MQSNIVEEDLEYIHQALYNYEYEDSTILLLSGGFLGFYFKLFFEICKEIKYKEDYRPITLLLMSHLVK